VTPTGRLLTAFLLAGAPAVAVAQWRPEERVVIGDFSHVTAIAASPSLVFAATTQGLIIYDRQARTWRLPVTSADGYPAFVRVALADVTENAVWLGTADGWARYDADARVWQVGVAPGGVGGLMLDASDPVSGIYLQTATGWGFLPRGGFAPVAGHPLPPPNRRIAPLTSDAAFALAPAADALRALILTDARLRTSRFTCAARTPDQSDIFLGTWGMGIVRMDAMTAEWERLSFGLLAGGAGGLATDGDGIWIASVAGVGRGNGRRGLTWLRSDLSADSTVEGSGVQGIDCLDGRRVLVNDRGIWIACERGVAQVDLVSGRSRLFDATHGLPSGDALSLAPAPDGVWVGTARGLAMIARNDLVATVGTLSQPVYALAAVHDSLWVGSASGLGLVLPGSSDVVVPPDIQDQPALHAAIAGVALVGDTLAVATADQLGWRDPATHGWTFTHTRLDLGGVTTLAGDAGGAWIGGTSGLAFWDFKRGHFHTLHVPFDIPAGVRDLAVQSSYLWVSGDSGVVRFARDAARGR